jgi:hypothetical protein
LSAAADELVELSYLARYEFFKVGKYTRIRFHRQSPVYQIELSENSVETIKVSELDPLTELGATVVQYFPDDHFPKKLEGTRLVSIENGTATIAAGAFCDWIENRLGKRILQALQSKVDDITAVRFVA